MAALNENFFQKFPLVNYDNNAARNILARVKLLDSIKKNEIALLPYTVQDGERADQISNFYYGTPYYAWAIYLVNDIVDPYFDWPVAEYDFNNFLARKYGSIEAARDITMYYRVNWAEDSSLISQQQYDSLPVENKKYWAPNYGYDSKVLSYRRKELDWTIENNRLDLLQLQSDVASNTFNYTIGERIYQYSNTNTLTSKGTIVSVLNVTSNSTKTTGYLTLKQTDFANSSIYYYLTHTNNKIVGRTSSSNATCISQERIDTTDVLRSAVSNSYLTINELVYWTPVDAEDYERELNSQKKEIKVLDRAFIKSLEENLEALMK